MYKQFNVLAADDANISGLYNPSTNFKTSWGAKVTDLFNSNVSGNNSRIDVINFIFVIVGLLFFANLIAAGWDYMLSSGDPKKATIANTRLTNGLTGLIMAFTAYLLVRLISTLLGLGVNI